MYRIRSLFIAAIVLISCPLLDARDKDFTWGSTMDTVRNSLGANHETLTFYPDEKPQYKNKIMKHIFTMEPGLSKESQVLRVNSTPVTDYLFVKGKLYCVMESYENITAEKAGIISAELKKLYGTPSVQQENNEHTWSYSTADTRVIFQVRQELDGKVKSKIYYYPRRLFMMLISQ